MRYIDSGSRVASSALGSWLHSTLDDRISELRWQSGFFSADGLRVFAPTLKRLLDLDSPVRAVIGSNDGGTLERHVHTLAGLMGLPRPQAQLGVVNYSGAFFHPKTYHVRRVDNSQAAYVGSANLTASGIGSLHIEAGIILDTLDGDPSDILDQIASSVDEWFTESRSGFYPVGSSIDIGALTAAGLLSIVAPPRPPTPSKDAGSSGVPRPRLSPLVIFPALPGTATTSAVPPPPPTVAVLPVSPQPLPSAPNSPPYPPYLLFAPTPTAPTSGAEGLSGATLPGGFHGLVTRLNRDNDRHWRSAGGTANISLPVATVTTLRFGRLDGGAGRPRAEFSLRVRYISNTDVAVASDTVTNVMAYGFEVSDTGHGNIRMLLPRGPIAELLNKISPLGRSIPAKNDFALLDWPSMNDPCFKITFLERGSQLHDQATATFLSASAANQLVGGGACWLPGSLCPPW